MCQGRLFLGARPLAHFGDLELISRVLSSYAVAIFACYSLVYFMLLKKKRWMALVMPQLNTASLCTLAQQECVEN